MIPKNLSTNTSNPYVRVYAEVLFLRFLKRKSFKFLFPYFHFKKGKQKRKTHVVKNSLQPQYRYKLEFDLKPCLAPKPGASLIYFRVFQFCFSFLEFSFPLSLFFISLSHFCFIFSSETVGADSSMGIAKINLSKTPLPFRGNLDLEPEKEGKKATGYLDVKIEVD